MKLVQKPIKTLFGLPLDLSIQTKAYEVSADDPLAQNIPKEKTGYIFRRTLMRDLLAWYNFMQEPILLHGPTQCGKTSLFNQLANRLQIPVWPITGNKQLELQDLFGQYVLNKDGGFDWMDGPLTLAAKKGGWFMINEIDRIRPDVLVGLNDVMEMDSFTLSNKQGEIVQIHPDFRIVCTANSNLAGDEGGNYVTANIHDKSVLERFGMILEIGYPLKQEEETLLEKIFEPITDDELKLWFSEEKLKVQKHDASTLLEGEFVDRKSFINGLLTVAKMIRDQSIDGGNVAGSGLERTMSTSTLLRWAQQCITFRASTKYDLSPLHYALERSLTNGCTPTTKEVIHSIVHSVFGVEKTAEVIQ